MIGANTKFTFKLKSIWSEKSENRIDVSQIRTIKKLNSKNRIEPYDLELMLQKYNWGLKLDTNLYLYAAEISKTENLAKNTSLIGR